MSKYDLSIVIPARNEEFLGITIQNILDNIEGKTEVIAVLDGYDTPIPEIPKDPRLTVIKYNEPIGQRAATNQAVRLSQAKYVAKTDAHCAFGKGFDRILMADMQDDWTVVPTMRNLHAFDWVCEDGHSRYQGISGPCTTCGKPTHKEIKWIGKTNPQSTSYCFDKSLHFQYFNEYKSKQVGDLVESMSLQGSFFMLTRDKYWELNICDEAHGSWGQQGVEVACKTWLSGGRVIVNKKTWYAHMFRTQGGDFGFPYPNHGITKAREYSKELWYGNKWPKAIYPLQWLVDKFDPPNWRQSVGILYYTDNRLDEGLMKRVQDQIRKGTGQHRIVSVSLKPIQFGDNIVLPLERGHLTMHEQILAGLKALDTDIVFFVEHDVFYHPSHFEFRPPELDKYYYNKNLWRVRQSDGFAVKYDHRSLSQLCAGRLKLIQEYENRVKVIKERGWNRSGYEPGTRSIRLGGFSNDPSFGFSSKYPNIDIRHDKNQSASKWRPEDFASQRSCRNWQETTVDKIEGWDKIVLK